jgi:MIP family channel proteins
MRSAALLAEFLGTFILCFGAIGAVLSTTTAVGGVGGLLTVALASGLAVAVAVNAFIGVSGAHLNPAVTAAALATRRITPPAAAAYVASQLAGASAAAQACAMMFPATAVAEANLGIPLPAGWASAGTVLGVEILLTFLLVIVIFGSVVDLRGQTFKIGGFGIGLIVTLNVLVAGPVTGASMNPARSFGPALIQGHWDWHGFYWVAPVIGAVLGALVYHHLILEKKSS